ncbi:MAG: 16S rRNA (guanine(966)-N(2))-methyltransferase RsmD [Bacillota bacterium]|nr:16S rRNA (guanine(966)-N(2))-methyltransferase RsmD [Bacillota bacterium]
MRIISGTAKGRRLLTIPGTDTRPTTDRIKESIFDIIQFSVRDAAVADLFAGTGQMGIEALSRGASNCVFFDIREECVKTIRKNIETAGFKDKAQVCQKDYRTLFSENARNSYDIVFLDPPYRSGLLNEALALSTKFDILKAHGIIICESAADEILTEVHAPYAKGREYRYGSVKITLVSKTGE